MNNFAYFFSFRNFRAIKCLRRSLPLFFSGVFSSLLHERFHSPGKFSLLPEIFTDFKFKVSAELKHLYQAFMFCVSKHFT